MFSEPSAAAAEPKQTPFVDNLSMPVAVTSQKSKKRRIDTGVMTRTATAAAKTVSSVNDASDEADEVAESPLSTIIYEALTNLVDTRNFPDFVKNNMPKWIEEELRTAEASGKPLCMEVQKAMSFWVTNGCEDPSAITKKFDEVMFDKAHNFIINDHVVATVAYAKKTTILVTDSTQQRPLRMAVYMNFMQPHQGGGHTNVLMIGK